MQPERTSSTPERIRPDSGFRRTGAPVGQTGHMSDNGWYFDVSTGKVSQGKDPNALNRMGPYPDRETAERALEIAAERTRAADRADDEWNG